MAYRARHGFEGTVEWYTVQLTRVVRGHRATNKVNKLLIH